MLNKIGGQLQAVQADSRGDCDSGKVRIIGSESRHFLGCIPSDVSKRVRQLLQPSMAASSLRPTGSDSTSLVISEVYANLWQYAHSQRPLNGAVRSEAS
jgi:hypothetical protein